ncbi:asparagine synthase (glutamine-hydrolyzing) [Pontibacter sp. FD36]|uniref:asparagine synthase (glutamine-hydrolyzing) n=1 Tax=Pontibacter sp. FD36 TaxID=2789860 RepID=UPI0018A88688|nr:asparagine synthase (glutamine-hydrolyzing) [Pontibacter sp. FD36]MBF8964582.1 asparagine synthase (glutamine-hydrolyzing) [Pontibacter sp. FD36]
MCGITGFCDFTSRSGIEHLKLMTNALEHRGPDDSGIKVWGNDNSSVGFGHRRLSILDLSMNGHQPMLSLNSQFAIVYNGEVYNFADIRKELQQLGYQFNSNSDTEVILNAFIAWGIDSVHKFIGMFAYAIYDIQNQLIHIVRDRAGVKPLYYYFHEGLFLFSSELKAFYKHTAFQKQIDYDSVGNFLQYGYIPTPYTIFQNTHKLKPGHSLTIDLRTQQINDKPYWDLSQFYGANTGISIEQAIEEIEPLLISACNYRMVSDVPVGVFLSGGYDSTLVTALIQANQSQKLKTFCIGFDDKQFNEAKYAREVANHLGTDHTEYNCTPDDLLNIVPDLPYIYDEPFGDSSAVPTILVSRIAQKHVSVVLSADAGDEVFAGYGKYSTFLSIYQKYNNIPSYAKKALSRILETNIHRGLDFLNIYNLETRVAKTKELFSNQDINAYFNVLSQFFSTEEITLLLKGSYNSGRSTFFNSGRNSIGGDDMNSLLLTDFRTFLLDDILTKVDRATMSVSIEGREPLLDHRIAEYVAKLPSSYKIKDGVSKYMLKEIVHKYVPSTIMNRPKMGFSIPLSKWLNADLKPMVMDYFSPDYIKSQGIFDPMRFNSIRDQYVKEKKYNPQKMWFILMFQMWHEKWMN